MFRLPKKLKSIPIINIARSLAVGLIFLGTTLLVYYSITTSKLTGSADTTQQEAAFYAKVELEDGTPFVGYIIAKDNSGKIFSNRTSPSGTADLTLPIENYYTFTGSNLENTTTYRETSGQQYYMSADTIDLPAILKFSVNNQKLDNVDQTSENSLPKLSAVATETSLVATANQDIKLALTVDGEISSINYYYTLTQNNETPTNEFGEAWRIATVIAENEWYEAKISYSDLKELSSYLGHSTGTTLMLHSRIEATNPVDYFSPEKIATQSTSYPITIQD